MLQNPSLNKLKSNNAHPLFLPNPIGKSQENMINIFTKKDILLNVSLIKAKTLEESSPVSIKKLPLLWGSWLTLLLLSSLDKHVRRI